MYKYYKGECAVNTVKYSLFLKTASVFCILLVVLSFPFYTGAEGACFGGVYTDENGIMYSLEEDLTASVILGAAAQSVVIPETVTADGSVYTVVAVEQGAFAENVSVKSVSLPRSVTHVGDRAFFGCVSLESVTADGLLTAGNDVFTGTPFVTAEEFIVLGDVLLRYNGRSALVGKVPNVSFVADAFAYNPYIKTVILPETVKTVGSGAFALCEDLKNVSLPFSLREIGDKAFFGCVSLKGVSVSAGVQIIGESAFSGTPFLARLMEAEGDMIVLGDGVLLRYKGDAESVTLPSGIKYVSDAFAYTSVTSVTLPSGCTIGTGAFRNAEQLYKVKINGNFSNVGSYAFSGCASLEILSVRGSFSGLIGYGAFEGVSDSFTVYFKSGSLGKTAFEERGIAALSPSDLLN